MAPLGGICTPKGVSMNEDMGFHSWFTASHELAHNLGSKHDGDGNSCSSTERNIMAPSTGTVAARLLDNVYSFSKCSIDQIKKTLKGEKKNANDRNAFPRVCLMNKVCSHGHPLTEADTLPGTRLTPNEQCRIRFGRSSSDCGRNSDICLRLGCRNHNGGCTWYSPGAADGTPCGSNKWCRKGKCVTKTNERKIGTSRCIPSAYKATPKPQGCEDHPTYKYPINYANEYGQVIKRVSYKCKEIPLLVPHVCYDKKIRQLCCASCHKYGLTTTESVCQDVGDNMYTRTIRDRQGTRTKSLTCPDLASSCTSDKTIEKVCCKTCNKGGNGNSGGSSSSGNSGTSSGSGSSTGTSSGSGSGTGNTGGSSGSGSSGGDSRCPYNGKKWLDLSDVKNGHTGKWCTCNIWSSGNYRSKSVICNPRKGCNLYGVYVPDGGTRTTRGLSCKCTVQSYGQRITGTLSCRYI